MFCGVALLALLATVQGRAVNISNTWVLPEESFPVFYRYFKDRISWYEADAVCQFHHANLVTVDTTTQYDAVRAYLKELDISSAVWVGLIRSNPDGDFTWTDYRGMSSDGYWSTAPDGRTAPLCAAANPIADYRWEARPCGGPTVASFICELPVPQWALGNEGCMVRELPALTILYLPESAAVQLTADCGLAGVKRIECTGNVKRDDLLQDLSCVEEDYISSTSTFTSVSTSLATTDALYTDEETTKDVTTEENITTDHADNTNQPTYTTDISLSLASKSPDMTSAIVKSLSEGIISKSINLDVIQNNNLQSNYIPKIVDLDRELSDEQLEKLEDEKLMQHKMIHEEIARLGNLDNIFTQPTDHFVPPLVMAKAKISNDMTVLSLAEKHAQQMAEKQLPKSVLKNRHTDDQIITDIKKFNNLLNLESLETTELPLLGSTKFMKPLLAQSKDKLKNTSPKKYIEKLDIKNKLFKTFDHKVGVTEITNPNTQDLLTSTEIETTTLNMMQQYTASYKNDEDPDIDLTVLIKEAPLNSDNKYIFTNYSGDVSSLESMNDSLIVRGTLKEFPKPVTLPSMIMQGNSTVKPDFQNFTFNQDVIKITVLGDNNGNITPIVFDVTTKMPVFRNDSLIVNNIQSNNLQNSNNNDLITTDDHGDMNSKISFTSKDIENYTDISNVIYYQNNSTSNTRLDLVQKFESDEQTNSTDNGNVTIVTPTTTLIETANINHESNDLTDANMVDFVNTNYKPEVYNTTMLHDGLEINSNETLELDYLQSPLLSAVNEPVHRPNRSRRPQQSQNRNKFNPFRILG